jgi:probable 2-oxoglutarate dehydrogenase E1 component DHKTD1
MVLLLPHGFDGAGPEHSTCHIERFLQNVNSQAYDTLNGVYDNLTGKNINFQVAQVTMPANYFHLLRRQMLRNYRKPLILAAPKIGLKHPRAVSSIKEFAPGTTFKPTYSNTFGSGKHFKKVIICSGKVYFDIVQKFESQPLPENHKTLVIRLEELAPFPVKQVENELLNVPHSADVYYL